MIALNISLTELNFSIQEKFTVDIFYISLILYHREVISKNIILVFLYTIEYKKMVCYFNVK